MKIVKLCSLFLVSNLIITTFIQTGLVIDHGAYQQANWYFRNNMKNCHDIEDRYVIEPDINYFAVFDGHNGEEAAEYAQEILHEILKKELKSTCNFETAVTNAFIRIDNEIMERTEAGTTAVVALISEDDNILYVANVADSRALVACTDGSTQQLSKDHNCKDPEEKKRVQKAGYSIGGQRIYGLAVSRSLGDKPCKWDFKRKEGKKKLELKDYLVSPIPHTKSISLNDIYFLVLVSDGITDKITNEEIIENVKMSLKLGNAKTAAQDLVKKAEDLDSNDDLTAVIVVFENFTAEKTQKSKSKSPRKKRF